MIFDKFIKFVKLLCQNTSNLCILIEGVTGDCVVKIPNSRYLTVWSEERTGIKTNNFNEETKKKHKCRSLFANF